MYKYSTHLEHAFAETPCDKMGSKHRFHVEGLCPVGRTLHESADTIRLFRKEALWESHRCKSVDI